LITKILLIGSGNLFPNHFTSRIFVLKAIALNKNPKKKSLKSQNLPEFHGGSFVGVNFYSWAALWDTNSGWLGVSLGPTNW